MKQTKIIAFEGIDGCGKTTQAELLKEHLLHLGYQTYLYSFPQYDGFFGSEIKKMLSGETISADKVDPKSMALWYALDRWTALSLLTHTMPKPDYIIFNRYTLSNIVYQSVRAQDIENIEKWIYQLEHIYLSFPQPNLYLIFDGAPEILQQNISQRDSKGRTEEADVYEKSLDFMKKIRKRYIECLEMQDATRIGIDIMDGKKLLDKEIIHKSVLGILYGHNILKEEDTCLK